jgi:hypothetical protein
MDIGKYAEKRKKNLINISKIGESYVFVQKKFDPMTGEETAPEVSAISRQSLTDSKAQLLASVADLEAILKEMDALDKNDKPQRKE